MASRLATNIGTRTWRHGSWGTLSAVLFDLRHISGDNIADTLDIDILPEGSIVHDAQLIIDDASNATVTLDVGFKSVSGTNQDNGKALFDVAVFSALARLRANAAVAPFRLQQDMYLRSTIRGANLSETAGGTLVLLMENLGPK